MSGDPRINPFRPTVGVSPPELIGRQTHLDAFREALSDGPGAPGRITIFTGQRGIGKTVMLNEVGAIAAHQGWYVTDLTATAGLLTRLHGDVTRLLDSELPSPKRRVTGVQIAPLGGVTLQPVAAAAADLRRDLTLLLDTVRARGGGVVLTVDEVHRGARDELRELGALAQHLAREERPFALAMAGLPAAVSSLLADDVLTFLRRADRHELASLDLDDVQDAIEKTVTDNGRSIDPDTSRTAAEASRGYPFLVQLVGYHSWRQARGERISPGAVDRGAAAALERLGALVHGPALQDLSDTDRRFVRAMAEDDGRSSVSDLARRLDRDRYFVNTYRRRLIAAQVVEEAGRGYLRFAIPYLRDYLRAGGG